MKVKILGVYAVDAPEPCHLVELQITDYVGSLNFADFKQYKGADPMRAQVAWDQRVLDPGTQDLLGRFPRNVKVSGELRVAFFLHYLDFDQPLVIPAGRVPLPAANIFPARLAFMKYERPC
jgi:hypothetical protein